LEALASGRSTRREAREWAERWVHSDDVDADVHEVLEALILADSTASPGTPLYGAEDFRAWLTELQSKWLTTGE
jgi:hypothetical protein